MLQRQTKGNCSSCSQQALKWMIYPVPRFSFMVLFCFHYLERHPYGLLPILVCIHTSSFVLKKHVGIKLFWELKTTPGALLNLIEKRPETIVGTTNVGAGALLVLADPAWSHHGGWVSKLLLLLLPHFFFNSQNCFQSALGYPNACHFHQSSIQAGGCSIGIRGHGCAGKHLFGKHHRGTPSHRMDELL